jgi:hypothetical protein
MLTHMTRENQSDPLASNVWVGGYFEFDHNRKFGLLFQSISESMNIISF